MCCEICPNYPHCEEEGHLNKSCCNTCPDYLSCYGASETEEEADSEELKDDELNEEQGGG
jgi:hypothetical protein